MASDPSLKSAPLPASYITYPDAMTRGKPPNEHWHCGICGATGKSLGSTRGSFGWLHHLWRQCRND